jgi:hypothetical protein
LVAALLLAGCRASAPLAAIDPELASCVPASTEIAAGIRLDALRASPLFARLPASARALIEPAGAEYLLLALTPEGLVIASIGKFQEAPAGAKLLTPRIALSGSAGAVAAATASHRAAPGSANSGLMTLAEPLAAQFPLWIAARGSATLPLSGNLSNLNNLLHSTRSTTIGLQPGDPATAEATGLCASPAAAQRLEETVRALISLASAAHVPSSLLDNLRFHTDGANLRVTGTVPLATLDALWR